MVTKLATPPAPSAPPADVGDDTPAPSKRAAALPPDERRSMIVAATLPLLLEHGDRVTTRQIAEAAGIAEGTIFRAFADKDEMHRRGRSRRRSIPRRSKPRSRDDPAGLALRGARSPRRS